METTIENNQVAIIENSLDVLKTYPEILIANQTRKDKAIIVGNNILSAIANTGMNPELDERAMKYLTNIATAKKEMNESRAAVTQIMDQLKGMFTTVENDLDVKKPGTIPARIQEERNAYAKKMAEEQERKRREAERDAAKKKEAIELRSSVESKLSKYFNDYLLSVKTKFQNQFNDLQLENFADNAAAIRQYEPTYSKKHFEQFSAGLYSSLHNAEELKAIETDALEGAYEKLNDKYKAEMIATKTTIVEQLPSKHAELIEQKRLADERERLEKEAAAERDEKQRKIAEENLRMAKERELQLQEEQKRREEEEQIRLKKEAEEFKAKEQQEIDIKAQGEQTMVMFDQEAALAEATPAPEVRQGFEITVLHPVGYTQLFALWFENEGKNLPVDKIGNTKLDQMKAWAEKKAHKDGTKIESKFLKYEESFKAVNRKVK